MRCSINRPNRSILVLILLVHILGCSDKTLLKVTQESDKREFLSEGYNHFEGGVLFTDTEEGLSVLWRSSFKYGRVYKENLGFFLEAGLLILPNYRNTQNSSAYNVMHIFSQDNKLFVAFHGTYLEVLGIIHSHPDRSGIQTPTPGRDYPFGYLGIHNYVMSKYDLFDAYKDCKGIESFKRLGPRNSYANIPLIKSNKAIVASR